MKINWKVRFKNPVFLISLLAGIASIVLSNAGITWGSGVTWLDLGNAAVSTLNSPFALVSIGAFVWSNIYDPTTPGVCDSDRANSYVLPGVSKNSASAKKI